MNKTNMILKKAEAEIVKFRDQRKNNNKILLTNMSKTGTSEKSNASFGWLLLLTSLCNAGASGR